MLPTPEQGYGVHSPAMGALGHSLLGAVCGFGGAPAPRGHRQEVPEHPRMGSGALGGGWCKQGRIPMARAPRPAASPFHPPSPSWGSHPAPAPLRPPLPWHPPRSGQILLVSPPKKLGIDGHHGWKGQSPGLEEGARKAKSPGLGADPWGGGDSWGGTDRQHPRDGEGRAQHEARTGDRRRRLGGALRLGGTPRDGHVPAGGLGGVPPRT